MLTLTLASDMVIVASLGGKLLVDLPNELKSPLSSMINCETDQSLSTCALNPTGSLEVVFLNERLSPFSRCQIMIKFWGAGL